VARPISTRPTIKLCHSNRNWDMVEKLVEQQLNKEVAEGFMEMSAEDKEFWMKDHLALHHFGG